MTDGKGEKGRARGGLMSSMSGGNNGKRRPYALLLILALGAAVLSVVMLQKMRERRVFAIMLQERDSQLLSLQLLLEKEKAVNQDIKKKLDELKEKSSSLRTQRQELKDKLVEAESATTYLKVMQQELESALVDKENQIKLLADKTADGSDNKVDELTKLIQEKDAEIEDLKKRISDLNTPQKTEEQLKVTESSTTAETKTNEATQTTETVSGETKEENWVTFKTNLEEQTKEYSEKEKEGRGNLEVKVDGENIEKEGSQESNQQFNEQMIQGNTSNENGEVTKNEEQDQRSGGGSGARKLKMFTSRDM